MTMCKHKSGGMGKPSGATSHQGAMNNQSVTTYPSQDGSSRPNTSLASTSQNGSIQNQMSSGIVYDAQNKASPLSIIPVSGSNHMPNEAHNQLSHFIPPGSAMANPVYQADCSYIPECLNQLENSKSDDSEDEDVITELSPMLLGRSLPSNYQQPHLWKTNNTNGNEYLGFMGNHQNIVGVASGGNFPNGGPYVLPCVNKCLDFNVFQGTQSQDQVQVCGSYSSVPSGSWLFPPQETLPNNCDINCTEFPLLYAYSNNGNDGDGCLSPVDSNSCMTDTYSSSTMNTDPLPGPSGLQRHNSVHWEIGTLDNDNEKDEEFRMRSYSLTPTVNFAVFESESASETEDNADVFLPSVPDKLEMKEEDKLKVPDESFQIPVSSFGKVFPISPSAAQLSIASSYGDSGAAICKICHMTAKENDPLISPCRCAGTMQYIHCGCLMRWLEISSKRSRKPASCELCQYQYHWHKKFKVSHWQFPHCSRKDKILHLLFFISIIVMIACASITIMCFKQDKGTKVNPDRTELTQSEIITLICGVAFFLAFFVAMYVEVKSHSTIYKLLVKFVYLNQQWYIDEYEKKESAPVAV